MKMLKLTSVLVACMLGSGCGAPAAEVFMVDGRTYTVPSRHLRSSGREPHVFMRIKHPDRPYELVYDSRAPGAQQGPGVPRLFSVNDEEQSGVEYYPGPGGTIVCRRAVHPKGGCGMRLEHGGVEWTLLFPVARTGEAASFKREATALLDRYRS
jgi:hypothetical protein